MSDLVEYASKATAIRGLARMGVTDKAEAEMLIQQTRPANIHDASPNKFLVDKAAVTEFLASKQRGDEVVAGEAKQGEAAKVTDSAKEQMSQDEIDNDLAETCGYSHCPSCNIHLSNGLMDFDSLADQHGEKEAFRMQKHQWACMGCNAEWGAAIPAPGGKGRKEPTRHYTNKSSVDGAVQVVWDIANSMPDARRKDVIQAAVDKGVAFYTARTQYQKWFKAQKSNKAK